MKAIIMAGGLGTRLRPLTCRVPKPMVPVVNRPILEHTVTLLKRHNINDLVILLFHLPQYIQNYFEDGAKFGVRIVYVSPEDDYGTAGAVKQAAPWIDETCLVVSGDAITDLDLTELVNFHRDKGALLTMALSHVRNPSPFGMAMTDTEGRVTRFLEKPSWGQIFSDTVNMGIYVIEPEVLEFVPEAKEYYFAKDLFPKLVREGEALYGFVTSGYWKDIGDLRTYQQVHWDWFDGRIPLQVKERHEGTIWMGKDCQVGGRVRFEGPVLLGDGCLVEDGASLSHSVIGDYCAIGRDAVVDHTVLWDHVKVEKNAVLHRDVVATGTRIGQGAFVDDEVYISDRCVIGAHSKIHSAVKIWPEKEVDAGAVVNASLVWGDKWQRELFVNSRVTGLANLEITPEFGAKLGAALGTWLGKGTSVVMSRDVTTAARMINRAIISGLMSSGVQVHDLQVTPIPVVRYTLRSGRDNGGLHIRRSPFEKKLLDILFFDRYGRDFPSPTTKAVERIFYREDFPRVSFDDIADIDFPVRVAESYVQDFLAKVDGRAIEAAKFRVVIDYSFGAATKVFPAILGSLDCEVVSLNALLQADKLTRTPKGFKQALKQLARIVTSTRAHVGFLIDAGAEKIFCVDEQGRIVSGERLAVLVTRLFLEVAHPRKIAVPVSIPLQVEKMAAEKQIELVYTGEDGGSLIQATTNPEIQFAAETKGGFIFTDFHFAFDGMFAIVKILELLAKTGQTVGRLNDEVPQTCLVKLEVPCAWDAKGKIMRHLIETTNDQKRRLTEGVKLYFDEAWVLVVPDREKAFCHILAEAQSEKRARQLAAAYQAKVLKWM